MSNAIIKVDALTNKDTGIMAPVEGFEGISVKPSQIRLIQQGSSGAGETVKVGKLVDTLSGNHYDKLLVVPLEIRAGRVFFPPDKNVGGTPLCRSNDGIVPANNVPERQASSCAICPHGPKLWRTFKQTGIKPDCDETQNLLFIERESGFPHYLTIKGSSIKLFKSMQTAILREILMNRTRGLDLKLYDFSFEIVPTKIQGAKGNYYILNFANPTRVANQGEYGPLYDMFVKSKEAVQNDESTDDAIDGEFDEVNVNQGVESLFVDA
jgi:hypothetical protein